MSIENSIMKYMGMPYTIILRQDEEGDFIAQIEELQGCLAHGETEGSAIKNLREAQEFWIRDSLESGHPIPDPQAEEIMPSGKWLQRAPKSIHKRLIEFAKRENVSLNSFVVSVLSRAVGYSEASTSFQLVSRVFSRAMRLHHKIDDTWILENEEVGQGKNIVEFISTSPLRNMPQKRKFAVETTLQDHGYSKEKTKVN